MGKLVYLFRSLKLPEMVLKTARQIIYQSISFCGGEKKGIACSHMVLSKEEGGLGISDPWQLVRVALVKRVWRMWDVGLGWIRD